MCEMHNECEGEEVKTFIGNNKEVHGREGAWSVGVSNNAQRGSGVKDEEVWEQSDWECTTQGLTE